MRKDIGWKLFLILDFACVIGSMLVLPFAAALSPAAAEFGITPAVLLIQAVSNFITFSIVCFLGLFFAKSIGFRIPIIEGMLSGENKTSYVKSILPLSIGMGALGFVLIFLFCIPFRDLSVTLLKAETSVATWKAFLASLHGGIGEEVMFRLFLVSLFVWITMRIKKTDDGLPTDAGVWISIVLSAVLFGLGHLPITGGLTPITFDVVLRAVLLNSIIGIICGWLYWKKGLESAMIAHFTADIFLHVITPAVALWLV